MTEKEKQIERMYNPAFVESEQIIAQLEEYQKEVLVSKESALAALRRAGLI